MTTTRREGDTAGVMTLRRLGPTFVWIAGLLAVGALMLVVGTGQLEGPQMTAPSTWSAWATSRPAPDAAIAVLRLVVLALDGYLLVVTLVAILVRVVHAERAISVADLLTVPAVLRVVQAGLGVGLVGASVAAAASGTAGVPTRPTHADVALISVDDEPPTIRELPEHAERTTTTTSTTVAEPGPAPSPGPVTASAVPALVAPELSPAAPTWLVHPGDHFWSIAERTLADAWGRAPTDAEIVPYWHEVIERNRDQLADRGNADLIFPGQTFVLPATPAMP